MWLGKQFRELQAVSSPSLISIFNAFRCSYEGASHVYNQLCVLKFTFNFALIKYHFPIQIFEKCPLGTKYHLPEEVFSGLLWSRANTYYCHSWNIFTRLQIQLSNKTNVCTQVSPNLNAFFVCFLSLLPIVPMDKNLLPNQSLGTQLESTVLNLFADN